MRKGGTRKTGEELPKVDGTGEVRVGPEAPVGSGPCDMAGGTMVGGKVELTDSQKSALGFLAKKTSRQMIIDQCTEEGLTVKKVAKTVVEALEAHRVLAQLDPKGEKGWQYSKKLVDHVTRLKAVEEAVVLLDLKPTEKVQVGLTEAMSDEEIDARLKSLIEG